MKEKNYCPFCGQPIPKEKMKELDKKYGETIKADANRQSQIQIENIEKENQQQINAINSHHRKQQDKLFLRVQTLERALQHKTSGDYADEGQQNLLLNLKNEFPLDEIVETKKGKEGADIFHYVNYKNQRCGLIIYEVKNVQDWNNRFIEQANKEKVIHGTQHVILVTNVFPANEQDICFRNDVMIISPKKAIYIAKFFRDSVINLYRQGLSQEEQEIKVEQLYKYLTSDKFKQDVEAQFRSVEKLNTLQGKEQRTHKRTWATQQKEYGNLRTIMSGIEGEINSVLEQKIPVIKITPTYKKKKKTTDIF